MANYREPAAYQNTLVLLKSHYTKLCFWLGLLSYFVCAEFCFAGESNLSRNKGFGNTNLVTSDVVTVIPLSPHTNHYERNGRQAKSQTLGYQINTSVSSRHVRGSSPLEVLGNAQPYYSLSPFQYFILAMAFLCIAAAIARIRLKTFFYKSGDANSDGPHTWTKWLVMSRRRSRQTSVKRCNADANIQATYPRTIAQHTADARSFNVDVSQIAEVGRFASYDRQEVSHYKISHLERMRITKAGTESSTPASLGYFLRKAVGTVRRGKEANVNPLHVTHDIGYKALVAAQTNPDVAQLIECLLEYFYLKKAPFVACEIDMNYLARESFNELSMLAASSLLKCEIKTMPMVMGDRLLLRQVWINLIGNALKFSSDSRPTFIEVGGYKNNTENIYYVRDNGVGFDEKRQALMFHGYSEMSEETTFHGSVGLAIVYCIIRHHGGRVWATSRMDEGTVFYFSIPIRSLPSEGKQ